jgi:alkaline phosphatase
MTRIAIDRLAPNGDGFCVMIEGARVDHAAHGNDAAALVHDMLAFDDAVRVATDIAADDPETLVIVTTDHANANPGLARYGPYDRYLSNLAGAKHSFEWVFDEFKSLASTRRTSDAFADLFQRAINVELTRDERMMLHRSLDNVPADAFTEADKTTCVMGSIAANHFGVAFNSPNHTSDPVLSLAMGPGADRLPRVSHLTDTHDLLVKLFALPPVT